MWTIVIQSQISKHSDPAGLDNEPGTMLTRLRRINVCLLPQTADPFGIWTPRDFVCLVALSDHSAETRNSNLALCLTRLFKSDDVFNSAVAARCLKFYPEMVIGRRSSPE